MDTRFGRSAQGLLQRLRPERITVSALREAADALAPELDTPSLRMRVVDRPADGPVVVLEEGERRLRVQLAELADAMTRACVPATSDGVSAALSAWVAHRPVTDSAAAASGIAVLDWADAGQTAVGRRVVVPRGELALPWTPSPVVDARAVHRTRAAALGRARELRLDLRVEGPVALWSHPTVPALATAALMAPERVRDRIAAAGVAMTDMHVVVTPRRPVACAGAGIAARLAGDTTEACVTLPWHRLADLPWL